MAVPLLIVYGCKAKQTVIKENTTTSIVDTTKAVVDTMGAVVTTTDTMDEAISHIDTTKTAQSIEQSVEVEFVDGGGVFNIDTAGNVTIHGIKAIKGIGRAKTMQFNGVTNTTSTSQIHNQKTSTVQSHREQAGGLTKNEAKQSQTEEKTSRAIRWYERPLIWIGSLCCIAVLLWLIFIYIHKKH